jgi:hypothetical protein
MWLICYGLEMLDKAVMIITRALYAAISSAIEVCPGIALDGLVDWIGSPVITIADLTCSSIRMLGEEPMYGQLIYRPDRPQPVLTLELTVVVHLTLEYVVVLLVGILKGHCAYTFYQLLHLGVIYVTQLPECVVQDPKVFAFECYGFHLRSLTVLDS